MIAARGIGSREALCMELKRIGAKQLLESKASGHIIGWCSEAIDVHSSTLFNLNVLL